MPNTLYIIFIIITIRLLKKDASAYKLVGFANKISYLFLVINILAILLNVFGRVTLARTLMNDEKLSKGISKLLAFLTIALWLIVFTGNVNVYTVLYEIIMYILFDIRKIGSTSFTFGNLLLFFVVIYLSTLAQRYVGYMMGQSNAVRELACYLVYVI
jgi:potassium efflux system protein